MISYIQSHYIEIIGAILGIIYLYFEYNADIKMWISGIFMSGFYFYVYIDSRFYAFAIINIYYIVAGIYGWLKWKKTDKSGDNFLLKKTPIKLYVPILVAICLTFTIISYLLIKYTNSSIIFADSFITTLSIVSMWMLAQKYIEQWLLLIILNAISVFIYFNQMLYPTCILYLVYTIASIFGYLRWRKFFNKHKNDI